MTEQATIAQPTLPPAVSADSKRNAFYTDCRSLKVKKPYAMCQYLIDNTGDASLQVIYSDCLSEIRHGRCTAAGMRDEEKLKGQAIYFIERVKGVAVVAQQDAWVAPSRKTSRSGYQRDKYAVGAPVTPSLPAPAAKPVMPEFDGNIYAAALNIAAKRNGANATNRQPASSMPEPVAVAPAPAIPAIKKVAAPQPIQVTVRAGESPLEMARRLRAQQEQA